MNYGRRIGRIIPVIVVYIDDTVETVAERLVSLFNLIINRAKEFFVSSYRRARRKFNPGTRRYPTLAFF